MAYLSSRPIAPETLTTRVMAPERGALASFVGLVRDHHAGRRVVGLEYSAYEPMAEAVLDAIVTEVERQWPVRLAVCHRVGQLAVGDVAVVVAAAAGHRDEAFAACRHAIEEIKRRVPIWKRERYQDGTEAWVDPTAVAGTSPAGERSA